MSKPVPIFCLADTAPYWISSAATVHVGWTRLSTHCGKDTAGMIRGVETDTGSAATCLVCITSLAARTPERKEMLQTLHDVERLVLSSLP